LHLTIDAIGGWLGLGSGEGVGSLPYGWGLGWWGSGKGRDCLAIYGEGWDKGREVEGVYCMCRERGMGRGEVLGCNETNGNAPNFAYLFCGTLPLLFSR